MLLWLRLLTMLVMIIIIIKRRNIRSLTWMSSTSSWAHTSLLDSRPADPCACHYQSSAWLHSLSSPVECISPLVPSHMTSSVPQRSAPFPPWCWHGTMTWKCFRSRIRSDTLVSMLYGETGAAYPVGLLPEWVGLPHQDAETPHVAFGREFQVVHAFRCVPLHGPLPVTFRLKGDTRKIISKQNMHENCTC